MCPMMAPVVMEGEANSGFGVMMAGFHAALPELPRRISQLPVFSELDLFCQCESDGYVSMLVCHQEVSPQSHQLKFASFIRTPDRFFIDLKEFLTTRRVAKVKAMSLLSSAGSLVLTILYFETLPLENTGA